MHIFKHYLLHLLLISAVVTGAFQVKAVTIEELGDDGEPLPQAVVPYTPPAVPDISIDMPDDTSKKAGKGTARQLLEEAEKQTNIVEEFKRDVWKASLDEADETNAGFFGSMWIGFRNTMVFSGKKAVQIAKPVAVAATKAKIWSWFI